MDRHSISLLVIILFVYGSGCKDPSPDALVGLWKAREVIEDGDTLELDLTNVYLDFQTDQNFKYRHTQRDSLAGTYELKKGLIRLYVSNPLHDTIIIQLTDLRPESLVLRMNHEGKERFVTMVR